MSLVLPKCNVHPDARALTPCPVCGNTVCAECVKLHGYFCSEECKASYDKGKSADAPAERAAIAEDMRRLERRLGFWFKRVPIALLAVLVVYIGLRFADRSGTLQWTVPASRNEAFQDLFYGHDSVYALIENGQCWSYDAGDARRKWVASLGDVYPDELVALDDGLLVLGYGGIALLNPVDGAIRWQNALATEQSHRSIREDGIVVVHVDLSDDAVAAGNDEYAERTYRRTLSLLEPDSGDVRWDYDCGDREVDFIDASDALVFSISHVPVPYRMFPCERHVRASDLARVECEACEYRPAAKPEFEVRALDRVTGKRQWGLRLRSEAMNGLHASDDRVLLIASQTVYALDMEGKKVWSFETPGSPGRSLLTDDAVVLVLDGGGLVCLDLDDGRARWKDAPGWISEITESDESLIAVVSRPRQAASARDPNDADVAAAPPSAERQLLTEIMGDLGVTDFGEVGFLAPDTDAYLVAYDLGNGRLRWEQEVDYPDVVIHDNECYVLEYPSGAMSMLSGGNERTVIRVYAADDGTLHWTYDAEAYLSEIATSDQAVFLISTVTIDAGPLPAHVKPSDPETSLCALRGRSFVNRLTRR